MKRPGSSKEQLTINTISFDGLKGLLSDWTLARTERTAQHMANDDQAEIYIAFEDLA